MSEETGSRQLPEIDCVVIGVNAAATLKRCLQSIIDCDYPQDKIAIHYVDGGSTDDSLAIADSFATVNAIALNPEYPTPGLGRNCGWRSGTAPLVQFLDSDTILDPDWLKTAVEVIMEDENIGAVTGLRQEMHPEKSVYNWLGDLEWNAKPGESESFGGDVLVRRQALIQCEGYDEVLVGGEDPELSRRLRLTGWRIIQLDRPMTLHDLAMTRFSQYWKRAYRSGYGFAAVTDMHKFTENSFWYVEMRRIIVRGGGSLLLILLAFLLLMQGTVISLVLGSAAMLLALILLFFPRIFRVKAFMQNLELDREQARVYAWHCSIVVLPDIFGVARYYLGKLFGKPLRNKRNTLGTATLKTSAGG